MRSVSLPRNAALVVLAVVCAIGVTSTQLWMAVAGLLLLLAGLIHRYGMKQAAGSGKATAVLLSAELAVLAGAFYTIARHVRVFG
jgi:protein-S-isoprenylcysteine O-methyltransferase Ste14